MILLLVEAICTKKRWLFYILIGILFGVFDFYFLNFVTPWSTQFSWFNEIVGFVLTFGVWLLPSIPILIYEKKSSPSLILPTFANCLTWCISVIIYYLTNMVQLVVGSSTQPYLSIAHYQSPDFWTNWSNVLVTYIVGHILEWIIFAVISSLVIGILFHVIDLLVVRKPPS